MQRGSNENTNGLLRQYFLKGTDLSQHGADELVAVAHALNTTPRKTLDWRTPAEALDQSLKHDIVEGVLSRVLRRPVEYAQFTSMDWASFLRHHNLVHSMSRRGNCHDNSVAEPKWSAPPSRMQPRLPRC